MAENNSDESYYCDTDEEIFIGKITEKEWAKAALFGQNYYSPTPTTPKCYVLKNRKQMLNRLDGTSNIVATTSNEVSNSGIENVASSSSQSLVEKDYSNSEVLPGIEQMSYQTISEDECFLKINTSFPDSDDVVCIDNNIKQLNEEFDGCVVSKHCIPNDSNKTQIEKNDEIGITTECPGELTNSCIAEIDHDKETFEIYHSMPNDQSDKITLKEPFDVAENIEINSLSISSFNESLGQSSLLHDSVSLNGISDSVLNISVGSSLLSFTTTPEVKTTGLMTKVNCEEATCEGDELPHCPKGDTSIAPGVHLSVDEPDEAAIEDRVKLTMYNLCCDKSSVTSYFTAYNSVSEFPNIKPSGDSFQKYRDPMNDTELHPDSDIEFTPNLDDDDDRETSFEVVVQQRQNSFIKSEQDESKTTCEKLKPRIISKLPVFCHNTKTFVRPATLNVAPNSALKSNNKWLNNEQKDEGIKIKVEKEACEPRGRYYTPMKNNTQNKVKECLKSDTKTSATRTPNSKNNTPLGRDMNSKFGFSLSQSKNKYKNILSPIRSYINHGTPVLQEKKVANENIIILSSSEKKMTSHLPVKVDAHKIVQKLDFKVKGLENINPSRDTLPPRSLQQAEAVILKPQSERSFPKMGDKLTKILHSTPRPRVVQHQGRVKTNSPLAKGVLVESPLATSDDPDISIRIVKTAEHSNSLKK